MNERKTRIDAAIAGRPAKISVREWRVAKPKGQVICLHGFGVTGAEFAPMAESLNRHGLSVFMPDWIGHGDSEYFGDPDVYQWECYVQCMIAVMRRYHAHATHYVGTSWGGALLLLIMLSHKILPQSATFVDVPLRSSENVARHRGVFEAQSGMKFKSVEEANAFIAAQRPDYADVPERFRRYFNQERYRQQDGEFIVKFDPAILPAQARLGSLTYDYVNSLQRIRFKAMFLYGKASPYRLLADFVTLCARAPHLRYRDDMPGKHPPALLHENEFVHIVDFIRQTNPVR